MRTRSNTSRIRIRTISSVPGASRLMPSRSKGFQRFDWSEDAAVADVGTLFDYDEPRPSQRAMSAAPLDRPLLILESETGSGKTEGGWSCVSRRCGVTASWTVCTSRCRRVPRRSNCTIEYVWRCTDFFRRRHASRPFLQSRAISSLEPPQVRCVEKFKVFLGGRARRGDAPRALVRRRARGSS